MEADVLHCLHFRNVFNLTFTSSNGVLLYTYMCIYIERDTHENTYIDLYML